MAEECNDKSQGKLNFYYGAPLVLFVTYDKTACWTNPQNGEGNGQTDATIVATHMMLEAASLDLGTVWISYFDQSKGQRIALPAGNKRGGFQDGCKNLFAKTAICWCIVFCHGG